MWVIPPSRVGWLSRSARSVARWRGSKRARARPGLQPAIGAKLRLRGAQQRDQAHAAVRRIAGELAGIADTAAREATAVLRNARRALRRASGPRKGRLQQAINHLDT